MPIRLLVVADDFDAARSMTVGMASYGYEIAVAKDVASALSLAAASNPDFVLVDLGVPRHDEVILQLRATLGPHPILVALANLPTDQLLGVDLHIAKPIDLDVVNELLTRLHRWDERPACIHPSRRFASRSPRSSARKVS
jgi:two-component system KDP operon response regulator KdpE